MVINEAKQCRICGNDVIELIDFGEIYINDFPKERGHNKGKAPMILDQCIACSLVQMRHTVDPQILYGDQYWYESALNPKLKQNLLDIAEIANQQTVPNDTILDIGANDGTLLSGIADNRIRIGCEPASNLWNKLAHNCDVMISHRWDWRVIPTTKCKIVTAIGMLYDLDNPNQFIEGVNVVLADDGIFIAQLMALAPMLKKIDLGNVCHEHLEYYSYRSLVELYERNGLEIYDIKQNDIQGGSYQIYARHLTDNGSIQFYEEVADVGSFFEKTQHNGNLLRVLLKDFKTQGNRCYVYGASTKGNTMLQIWNLGEYFEGAAEIHPDKIGRYTVGTDIPIIDEDIALEYASLLFIPNFGFKDMFIEKLRDWILAGGKLVFAMPEVEVVHADNIDKHTEGRSKIYK